MELLDRQLSTQLHQIGKEAENRREEIEKNRCISHDLIHSIKESGALRLWVAQAYGGIQSHVQDLSNAIQTCAYYNGSLGWVVAVTGTASLGSGYLPPQQAKEIFGDTHAMTAGWAAPAGKAKKVKGGLQVSGHWAWGSGIRHATHIVGGVMIQAEGEERPQSALAYFDPKDVHFIDNWDVLGLKGSNSIDYEVKDLFVPDGKWIPFPVQKPYIDATLYRFSFLGALSAGVASVGLGLAARALHEIKVLCQQKTPNGASRTLSERPIVHEQIAKMEAKYQSAKLFLESVIQKNWKEAEQGKPSTQTKSELRLASTYTAECCVEIVQQAYKIGGGSSIWEGVKLQELLRDVQVMSQHGLISSSNYEIAGRVAFDLPVNTWLL